MRSTGQKDWLPAIESPRLDATTDADEPLRARPRAERVAAWLQPQDIALACAAKSVDGVLSHGAVTIARQHGMAAAHIHDALRRREQAASTAIGHGFAVPHARVGGIADPLTLYLRTAEPVPFGAADGAPTSHFFFIVVPQDGNAAEHLQLLAAFSRLVTSWRFRHRLQGATDADAVARTFHRAIPSVRDDIE